MKHSFFTIAMLAISIGCVKAQSNYTVNVDCTPLPVAFAPAPAADTEEAFQITLDSANQSGSVWNNNRINLENGFRLSAQMYFGTGDNPGADGITFTLHRDPREFTAIGGDGGWLGADVGGGVAAVTPSINLEFDTFFNGGNDILADHFDISVNGGVLTGGVGDFAAVPLGFEADGVTPINVEDSRWHNVIIDYQTCDSADTQCFTVTFDGLEIATFCDTLIDEVFGGDPENIIWGFTSATANERNLHAVAIRNFDPVYCCSVVDDPSFFHIGADTPAEDLAAYGITYVVPSFFTGWAPMAILEGGYFTLPDRVYLEDGLRLQVRGEDATLDLVNTDMVFGECAGIEVINGAEIKAYNSVFRPCNESTSWDGIFMTRTHGLQEMPIGNFRECTFINAYTAINMGRIDGFPNVNLELISEITIQNNLFSNCKRAIRMESLASDQAISGNTFQIDHVDEIDFYDLQCELDPSDRYIGILTIEPGRVFSNQDYDLSIHQNTFINATPLESSSEYIGILSNINHLELDISANNFTNMFNSINISGRANNRVSSISDNKINVSRRFGIRSRGESQILINATNRFEIVGNQITSTAEALPISIAPAPTPIAANHAFLQSAIQFSNSASFIMIRENVIDGFEVGIFSDSCHRATVSENTINAEYYGIYVNVAQIQANNNRQVHIKCNEIDMDLENSTTSVGIGVYYRANNRYNDNLPIVGNCIKNTTRGMEIISLETNPIGALVRLPNILNNYIYNYEEVGLLIQGDFNSQQTGSGIIQPQIGGLSGSNTASWLDGSNTFISNNENNGVFDIHFTTGPLGTFPTLLAINNDFGPVSIVNGGVDIEQEDEINYPSFAKCANQESVFGEEHGGGLASSGLYYCGINDVLFDEARSPIVNHENGLYELANNFQEILLETEHDGKPIMAMVLSGIKNLSDEGEATTLYNFAHTTLNLENESDKWMTYVYYSRVNELELALSTLTSFTPETEVMRDKITIEKVYTETYFSSQYLGDLTADQLSELEVVAAHNNQYAIIANKLIALQTNERYFAYNGMRLTQPLTASNRRLIELSESALSIYPNPTSNLVNIQYVANGDDAEQLFVHDLQGRIVYHSLLNSDVNQIQIDVSELNNGIYVVSIQGENGVIKAGRLVKN